MIKGITEVPQLAVSKIYIDSANAKQNQSSMIDLYIEKPTDDEKELSDKVLITFRMVLRARFPDVPSQCDIMANEVLSAVLADTTIRFQKFLSEDSLTAFEKIPISAKASSIWEYSSNGDFGGMIQLPNNITDLSKYVYYKNNTFYYDIPFEWQYETTEAKASGFLAFAFAMYPTTQSQTLQSPKILTEVVLNSGGGANATTGYMVIDDTFRFNGEEHNLLKSQVVTEGANANSNMPIPDQGTVPTTPMAKIHMKYGQPGDIWCGPHHLTPYTYKMPNGSLKNTWRLMAGLMHSSLEPHPYLYYVAKGNDKIVDSRSFSKLEQLFTYNNDVVYAKSLAEMNFTYYSGQKKKDSLDELIQKQTIASDLWYSLSPWTVPDDPAPGEPPKGRLDSNDPTVHAIFAIDKVKLLKQKSKLAGLLDKFFLLLGKVETTKFVNTMATHQFSITRIDKRSGEQEKVLATSNNIFASTPVNILDGKSNFRKIHPVSNIESGIDLYEFKDGGLFDNHYNNNRYKYKIDIEFRDPIIQWLAARLLQLRNCIQDLEELSLKMRMKIYDIKDKKFVDVYNLFNNRLHPDFIKTALASQNSNNLFPKFNFKFAQNECPETVSSGFNLSALPGAAPMNLEDLRTVFFLLKYNDEHESVKTFVDSKGLGSTAAANNVSIYIKNSLKLSETNPTQVQRILDLLSLAESRMSQALSLYTSVSVTKKEVGYTQYDNLKSTSKAKNTALIDFSHTFKEALEMPKTKDKFDWLRSLKNANPNYITSIAVGDYISRVQMYGQAFLSADLKETYGAEGNYTYSMLPNIFNMLDTFNDGTKEWGGELTKEAIHRTHSQVIRKKLLANNTDKRINVVLPEDLAFFGIKFDNDAPLQVFQESKLTPTPPTPKPNKSGGSWVPVDDNFGSLLPPPDDPGPFGYEQPKYAPALGSIENPQFDWQGGSLVGYPYKLARAINYIINSDLSKNNRKVSYISDTMDDTSSVPGFSDKTAPFMANIYRQKVSLPGMGPVLIPEMVMQATPVISEILFNDDGTIRFDQYPNYLQFLNLFGHVTYFDGFNGRATNELLTPSTYTHTSMIASPIWRPLTLTTLKSLGANKSILCRVMLEQNNAYLDKKTIDTYQQLYNFNKYFYISGKNPGEPFGTGDAFDPRNSATSIPHHRDRPTGGDIPGLETDVRKLIDLLDQERIEDKTARRKMEETLRNKGALGLDPARGEHAHNGATILPNSIPLNPSMLANISVSNEIVAAADIAGALKIPITNMTAEYVSENLKDIQKKP